MRAAWLEPHDQFEGVGAHELNPRYDHVDGDEIDFAVIATPALAPRATRVQALIATVKPRLDGIDVSHYQYDAGPLNWQQVANAPTFWNVTKLTQSTGYLDPTAARSRQSILAIGSRHRGLYHWLSSTTAPVAQAAWFLAKLGPLAIGEFVMLDAEESGITVAGVVAWCQAVESVTGRPCAVYSGAYVAGGTIWTDPRVRASAFGLRPMALAAYTSEAKARALPGVAQNPWHSWQFSSNGPVSGVSGRCDMNRVDSVAVYDIACGRNISSPTFPSVSQEDDMRLLTNGEPRDIHDGHDPWEPGKVMYKLIEGEGPEDDYAVHLPDTPKGNASVRARGAAQPMSNVDLDALAGPGN